MCAQMDAAVSRRKVCQTSISALQQNNNTIAVINLFLIASRSINDTEEKLQCRMCLSELLVLVQLTLSWHNVIYLNVSLSIVLLYV